MPEVTVIELSAEQTKAALFESGLWKQFACAPLDKVMFNCAHGRTHSFMIARWQDGAFDGWKLDGGTREQRSQAYQRSMERVLSKFGGEVTKPKVFTAAAGTN